MNSSQRATEGNERTDEDAGKECGRPERRWVETNTRGRDEMDGRASFLLSHLRQGRESPKTQAHVP
jgi:hypothetical protein